MRCTVTRPIRISPVLIAVDEGNANAANVRFFVDRAVPQSVDGYERIVYLFSGHDPDAVSEARVAWKRFEERAIR